MRSYDMIIVGAGAAGLLLADALGKDPYFREQSILLLEKEPKKKNDRTWCFWEAGSGSFDSFLHASWDRLHFGGKDYNATLPMAPYTYKMVRGIDFYREYHARLANYPNVTLQREAVEVVREEGDGVLVQTTGGDYWAGRVFNSLFSWETVAGQKKYPVLQQHFLGWFVRTETPVFDAGRATFMDFSIPQQGNTRFMYVLPFSEHEALVEYTLFSAELLEDVSYEAAIAHYMRHRLHCDRYEVLEKEKGRIPMTCYRFSASNTDRILHIGTAGGWAKPSTGYTFMNTHRNIRALIPHLKSSQKLAAFGRRNRFWWYDLLLLDILHRENHRGAPIFESLFRRRSAPLILKFLDEQTSPWEDLKVIWACPKKDFVKALLLRIFK